MHVDITTPLIDEALTRSGCLLCNTKHIKDSVVIHMTEVVPVSRETLTKDVYKIYRTYQDLVETIKENFMEVGRVLTRTRIEDGEILDGLNVLHHYLNDKKFSRQEDTISAERHYIVGPSILHVTTDIRM